MMGPPKKEDVPVRVIRFPRILITGCAALFAITSQSAAAATHCVNPAGTKGCFSSISSAVTKAHANDIIQIEAGTYKEDVIIGIPLTLIGEGSAHTTIDATGLPNGIFVDGYDHPGLSHVTIAGLSVINAQYEGVLVVNASNVTIRDNNISDEDKFGPVFSPNPGACAGQPAFETDETGDCGGALHLMGVSNSLVASNVMTNSADGILMSDETGETHDNLIVGNRVVNNPLDCGLTLASHAPVGSSGPYFAPHYGVDHNTLSGNTVSGNGVQVEGAGVGLFSDGNGPGKVTGNIITLNLLTGNGIGGVALHSHVGPLFGAPADNMDGNVIVGNYVSGNGADIGDTATPGTVGIQISSGHGGTPVNGTIISGNIIRDEDYDVAVNTPGTVMVHGNDLFVSGMGVGVGNICAFDGVPCTGSVDATQNYWGCKNGPGAKGCSSATGPNVSTTPWLTLPVL